MKEPTTRSSLFIVSLPRSLSTIVYNAALLATGFRGASWTSAGEILNVDRFKLLPCTLTDVGRKFTHPLEEPDCCRIIAEFLDLVAVPDGFVYKDVVQPFVISDWLTRKGFRLIRIKRDIAEVAYEHAQ